MRNKGHWYLGLYRAVSLLCVLSLLLSGLPASPPEAAQAAPQGPSPQETPAWERPAAQTATQDAPSGKGQISLDGPFGVQVNTYNGNLFYSRVDLFVLGNGVPLHMRLAYNSIAAHPPLLPGLWLAA